MSARFNRFLQLWNKYERPLAVFTVICGFSFDLVLAKRPDSIPDNLLMLFYLTVSAVIIVVLNMRSKREQEGRQPIEPLALLLVLQFCFGGLASNLLILYGKSGSISGSLLFIALLIGLLVGNELLKSRYAQLRFNIVVYYILLLTYLTIAIPTFILHTIGTRTFLISGAASLGVMVVFLFVIFRLVFRGKNRKQGFQMAGLIVGIFVVFNILYFFNIIPPVPLSLKSAGIYHSIEKDSAGNYTGTYEQKAWYEFWRDTSDTYTVATGQPAYCFSAVFAPGDLSTPILHKWQYKDPSTGKWLDEGEVIFPITGGRAEGYRGYSIEDISAAGHWRCVVETSRGQVIGLITFTAQISSSTAVLSTTTL